MARKPKEIELDFNAIMNSAIQETLSEMSSNSNTGLMNIIDFIDHVLKLELEDRKYFKIIMKMWYYNTPGNEDLELTDEDLELIDKIDNYGNGNPWLRAKFLKLRNGEITKPFKYLIACLGRRSGKAQPLYSRILTPVGWKLMGDIKVGDEVITQTGEVTRVNGVYPQGKKDIYEVTFSDNSSTRCCKEHLWEVSSYRDRNNFICSRKEDKKLNKQVLSLEQIEKNLTYGKIKQKNYSIPLVEDINFKTKNQFKIDPYILGCLLGDGSLSQNDCIGYSSVDQELVNHISKRLHNDIEIKESSKKNNFYIVKKTSRNTNKENIYLEELKKLKLLGIKSDEKFIPEIYKITSKKNRIEILSGLLDTDGNVSKNKGQICFFSTSVRLIEDVKFIVQSLGGTVGISIRKSSNERHKDLYYLYINLPKSIKPFKLSRKQKLYESFKTKKEPKRLIKSIRFIGKEEAQCISVEHPSHLYITDDFIVTHNTYISSVIQSYDTYKLLYMNVCAKCKDMKNVKPGEPCPECGTTTSRHPQAYFGQSGSEPLRIIMAATSLDQACDPGLKFFQERVLSCPLFEGKSELESEKVFFKTEFDFERIKKFSKASKNSITKGSIMARAIAANSKSTHGLAAVLISFDEFALFSIKKGDSEGIPDEMMLEALVPATSQFEVKHPEFGRVVMISAPQFRQGKFYEYFKMAQDTTERGDNYLMVQMPTWEWCDSYTKEFFLNQFSQEQDSEALSFDKMYGAQFLDESESSYLSESSVERAFGDIYHKKLSHPESNKYNYYMHIDASQSTCNYAYCIVHTEYRYCKETQRTELYFVEDTSYFWTPSKNDPDVWIDLEGNRVEIRQIWDAIVDVAKKFRVVSLSYDNMQTPESKTYFRRKNLPLRNLTFSGRNKKKDYYGLVKNALQENRVICCSDDFRLRNELLNLKVKETMRGIKIYPNPNGIVKTMDVADCFAGACFLATEKVAKKMPQGILMRPNPAMQNINAGSSIFTRELPNIKSFGG